MLLLAAISVQAAGWDSYSIAQLGESIERYQQSRANLGSPDEQTLVFVSERLRVHLLFSGRVRQIPRKKNEFIALWFKSIKAPAEMLGLFQQEVELCEAHDRCYWMPIQSKLLQPLQEEVGRDGQATFYMLLIGGTHLHTVVLVNEFEAREGDFKRPSWSNPTVEALAKERKGKK